MFCNLLATSQGQRKKHQKLLLCGLSLGNWISGRVSIVFLQPILTHWAVLIGLACHYFLLKTWFLKFTIKSAEEAIFGWKLSAFFAELKCLAWVILKKAELSIKSALGKEKRQKVTNITTNLIQLSRHKKSWVVAKSQSSTVDFA